MTTEAPPLLQKPLYLFDLPKELVESLTLRNHPNDVRIASDADQPSSDAKTSQGDSSEEKSSSTLTKGFSCGTCRMNFESLQEQRSHFRSDLHNYNVKQRARGGAAVHENDFEKLIGDLDESLSGSDSDDSDDSNENGQGRTDNLSALLRRQAKVSKNQQDGEEEVVKRGSGRTPLIWFSSSKLPSQYSVGVYRTLFQSADQDDPSHVADIIKSKQLAPVKIPPIRKNDAIVSPAEAQQSGPCWFLCMIGGGHFAAMIVALAPKAVAKQGSGDASRTAVVLAHKTFHRYTTRRKQGGAQSSYDTANGPASSAGSALRRYNEMALTQDIRNLLRDWKSLIDKSELVFVRATGSTNRNTLFGEYEGRVMRHNDPRIRGYPFSTRRATQNELMRAFVELTRVKWTVVDEAAIAQKAADEEKARVAAAALEASKAKINKTVKLSEEEEHQLMHTTQIQSLIRRSKAPALIQYLSTNSISADFRFQPAAQNHHTPTPLHLAASVSSPSLITSLLTKAKANPTIRNADGKSAYDLAGDRTTRDAFRLARHTLGETKWNWEEAGVPAPLTTAEIDARVEEDKQEAARSAAAESARRKADLEKLRQEDAQKETSTRERKFGKGQSLSVEKTGAEKREEEGRGMTPEMRMRLERERRARAAEERMKRLQGGG